MICTPAFDCIYPSEQSKQYLSKKTDEIQWAIAKAKEVLDFEYAAFQHATIKRCGL